MKIKLKKIFILVNDPIFVYQHLLPILDTLKKQTQIYIITAYNKKFNLDFENIKIINIPIKRAPNFIDIYALFKFFFIRLLYDPDICLSFTPKAGLINSLTRIQGSKSLHYFTGQRWANLKGLSRYLLKLVDKFILITCERTYCDSSSQAKFIAQELKTNSVEVLGKGSISGVNIDKFNIKKEIAFNELRKSKISNSLNLLNILEKTFSKKIKLICFVGRVNKDKGIRELIAGFKLHNKIFKDSYLLIIGPNELNNNDYLKIKNLKNCIYIDYFKNINLILPFAYCLILPSYREGFGSVLIEAAASKVPIIASDIAGPKDFIDHMKNGYLIKPKDSIEIKNALNFYRENNKLLKTFSENAYQKCIKYFSERYVCNLFKKEILRNI